MSGTKESLKNAITQVSAALSSLAIIGSAAAKDTAVMVKKFCYAAKIVGQEIEESVKDLVQTLLLFRRRILI